MDGVLRLAGSVGLGLTLVLCLLTASAAGSATLSPIGRFDQPIFITSDPIDPDRLLVVERPGRVVEVTPQGSELQADLTAYVACCASERGLLSIAPAPDFHESGLFYASYTGKPAAGGSEGDIHVDAFVADADAEVTRMPIITIGHSQEANHNAGQIQLGPDGDLYISTGDGGGGGDPFEAGQDLSSLLGKVLRITPEPGSSPGYSIPPDNPFAGPTAGADEIWAYGLRNPWRFSFDSLTGDLLIGDVGQSQREEIDLAASPSPGVVGGAGANYGWSCREGLVAYTDATPAANCAGAGGFTDPAFDYPHTDPDPPADRAYGCAITGGYVARDPSLGDLYGRYVYADYCIGEIRSMALPSDTVPATDRSEGISVTTPVSFGEDSCGRLYVTSGSEVVRIQGGGFNPGCPPSLEPPGGLPVTEPPPIPNLLPASPPLPKRPPVVGLEADDLGHGTYRLRVQLSACEPSGSDSIQLNRGGRRLATRPANKGCAARFRVRLKRSASFRALFRSGPGAAPVRSKRLSL
jgi:hypothetical protein